MTDRIYETGSRDHLLNGVALALGIALMTVVGTAVFGLVRHSIDARRVTDADMAVCALRGGRGTYVPVGAKGTITGVQVDCRDADGRKI